LHGWRGRMCLAKLSRAKNVCTTTEKEAV
jgi:hypothetical protein